MNKIRQRYEIAGLKVVLSTYYDRTRQQAEKYLAKEDWTEDKADIEIDREWDFYEEYQTKYPGLNLEAIEYMLTGGLFNRYLLKYNGCMLHSSAVVVDGYAYLFSANSGTGKSTHTQLWKKQFGEKAYIINDDKPVLRNEGGHWYVYGTPWSGKSNQNENKKAELGAIVFLERAHDNWIDEIEVKEAIPMFFEQTVRKFNQLSNIEKTLELMGKALMDTPIYKMGCNISSDAVKTAYERIRRV